MASNRPLRVLFLHATWHHTSEYNVHRLLAEKADPALVDCFFIWQTHTKNAAKNNPAILTRPDRNFYYDFGRDMSLKPKPPRWKRSIMMAFHFPLIFLLLLQKVWQIKPDAIYTSQQKYEVFLASFLSFIFRIPHIIHISYPVGSWLGKETVKIISHTPNLIACSDFVRRTALDAGIAPEQIETLLHGAHVEKYAIERHPEKIREEFDFPEDAVVVVTAARIDPGKGYTTLLRAFAKVHQEIPTVRLIACGEGTTGTGYEEHIKRFASNLNLDEAVVFTNFRDDLPEIFAGSDIFCLPTKEDALPLVFLGAMAAGLPVIGVRSGGVPEMVTHGVTGLLAEPDNPDDLADSMIMLLKNGDLAQMYGENGRERAFREFDPNKVSADWVRLLYRRLGKEQEFGECCLAAHR